MHNFDLRMISELRMISDFRERSGFEYFYQEISGLRTISGPQSGFDYFSPKKNKMKNFPTKMKEKIGAQKGRQLYGAPKWALIMPKMVGFGSFVSQVHCIIKISYHLSTV